MAVFCSLATVCVKEISEWIATGDLVATSGSTRVSRMDGACGNARDKGACARLRGVERRTYDVCTTNGGVCE